MTKATSDARVERTRRDLFEAFAELVMHQRYECIRVTDIIARAGIARSTFYEHFASKDTILIDSMSGMLAVLAHTAVHRNNADDLSLILDHLWDRRAFARIILNAPPYRLITRRLAELIETAWQDADALPASTVPAHLQAIQAAEGLLALIRSWLCGEASCSVQQLAAHLTRAD